MNRDRKKTEPEQCTIPVVMCSCIDEWLPMISDNYKAWDEYDGNGQQTKIKTGFINGKYYCKVSIRQLW
jgi:hypothetical protein